MNSIVEMLFHQAKRIPDKVCIIDRDGATTYKELLNETLRFATFLNGLGVKNGNCVLIQATQNASFLARTLAIHLVGASSVPIEYNCPPSRIQELAYITKAPVYISDKQIGLDAYWIDIKEDINGYKIDEKNTWTFPDEEWIGDLLFTTGTTGKSKGVMISHRAIVAAVENVKSSVELTEKDISIVPTPLNHAHALRRTYASIITGGTTILMEGVANLKLFFSYLEQNKVTGLYLMPAMLSYILKLSGDKLLQFRQNIRFVELGSAPLGDEERNRIRSLLPNSKVVFNYGATESGCTCGYDMNKVGYIPLCIGKASPLAMFEFANQDGQIFEATKENPGFIVTTGKMNMSGYYNEPELTKQVLKSGKIYSNDMGYMDKDGYIYFLGRQGDVINMGGIKISALEIEQVALLWEEIAECACVPTEDPQFGQIPKLYVVLKDKNVYNRSSFLQFLKERLELSRVPKEIVEIDKLPKTFNGKIIKRELE